MDGFFKRDILVQKDISKTHCFSCAKNCTCKNPKMKPEGKFGKRILIVNDRISEVADKKGNHLSRSIKAILKRILSKYDINLNEDCLLTSSVLCHSKSVDIHDVRLCQNFLLRLIEDRKPKLIITLGLPSIQSVFNDRFKMQGGIVTWENWQIPDYKHGCYVCTSYHPREIEQSKAQSLMEKKISNSIKNAVDCLDKPLPKLSPEESENKCRLLFSEDDIKSMLMQILDYPSTISFDYEAPGLNVYADWFDITTCSIYYEGISYAFVVTEENKPWLKKVLGDPRIKKVGANIKYEHKASQQVLGIDVKNWVHDTVIASHVLDNRTDISGVKFQAFVRLGVTDYSSDIAQYLKGPDKNSKNRITEAPIHSLLLYNALDSFYEHHIYLEQRRELRRKGLLAGYELFHNGGLAFVEVENTGFTIDEPYLKRQDILLDKKIKRCMNKLKTDPIIQSWMAKYGKDFNIGSDKQMIDILFSEDERNLEPLKFTDKGTPSTDKEALQKLGLSFAKRNAELGKYQDAKNTFLGQIFRCVVKGKIHPNYALNRVTTYRGSCGNPNFQNIPIRDKEVGKIIRGGIVPSPGNLIAEFDYSGAEVRLSYCYNRDPNLKESIVNGDMHRDSAMDCFLLPQDEVSGGIRYHGKNGFTFAEFYGDYYGNIAKHLWAVANEEELPLKKSGIPLKEHLINVGIKSFKQFESHIKEVEDILWNKRFKVYSNWKKKFYNEYVKRGYIDTLTGFRLTRFMDRKNVINYPVQGSAFHCLLWSMIRIVDTLKQLKYGSKVIGQVHDSIIMDLVPEEKDEVLKLVKRIMTLDVRDHWDWIDIPLDVECEISDSSWFNKQEIQL